MKGLFHYNKWTIPSAEKAVEEFEKAISLSPDYDQAYAGMALAYSLLGTTGYMDPSLGYKKVKEFANKALSINPENESALIALCYRDVFFLWKYKEGKALADRALSLNPKSPDANLAMSLYYIAFKDYDKAISHIEQAREIDPLSPITNRTLADTYYFKQDYETAIQIYDWLLEQDPEFKAAKEFKGWCYLMQGDYPKALKIFHDFEGNATHAVQPYAQLGYAYALYGKIDKAKSYLDLLQKQAENDPHGVYDMNFAIIQTGLGNFDEAFNFIDKTMDAKIGSIVFLDVSPIWKPLKIDPRFNKLLDKLGLSS